jgi:hypothetical protein
MTKTRKRLNKSEKETLERLRAELDDPMAQSWATYVNEHHFEVHRGASEVDNLAECGDGECIIFGNDGFAQEVRVQVEVARLVQTLERLGIPINGFGLSDEEGYSWALIVTCNDVDLLDRLVWNVWFSDVCGMKNNPVSEECKELVLLWECSQAA